MLPSFRLTDLPVAIRHGDRAATLPPLRGDPFDRILVAQAMIESLVLVTGGWLLAQYGVSIPLV